VMPTLLFIWVEAAESEWTLQGQEGELRGLPSSH
jgi:hypothetical protein